MGGSFHGPNADQTQHPEVHAAQKIICHQVNTLKRLKQDVAKSLGWDIKEGPDAGKPNGTLSKFMNAGSNKRSSVKLSLKHKATKEKALLIIHTFADNSLPAFDGYGPPPSIESIDDSMPPAPLLADEDDRAVKRQKCSDALTRRGL